MYCNNSFVNLLAIILFDIFVIFSWFLVPPSYFYYHLSSKSLSPLSWQGLSVILSGVARLFYSFLFSMFEQMEDLKEQLSVILKTTANAIRQFHFSDSFVTKEREGV